MHKILLSLIVAVSAPSVLAQAPAPADGAVPAPAEPDVDDTPDDDDDDDYEIPEVIVPWQLGDIFKMGGSAHQITPEELEAARDTDPGSVVQDLPGVYVRHEDGYGLRPNIGLRGANSDRSKKVTLTEDGVLFAPAPYSAPAAYYFPMMQRVTGIEVLKGPAAIRFGPQTIGGAINFLSRDLPWTGNAGALDLSYGMFNTLKGHAHYGQTFDWGGFAIEGAHISSDGFKDLDGGEAGDTGFNKQEIAAKLRYQTDPDGDIYQRAEVKLVYSRELSFETYLGLTDADFAASPNRRYAASRLGRMELERVGTTFSYLLNNGDGLSLTAQAYVNAIERSWRKLDAFVDGPSLSEILASPDGGVRRVFYDVLTGSQDSASDAESLVVGTNKRNFVSAGLQAESTLEIPLSETIDTELVLGARLHYDQIRRDHTARNYAMRGGLLVDPSSVYQTSDNTGESLAVAAWLQWAFKLGSLTLRPGARFEHIDNSFTRRANSGTAAAEQLDGDQTVILGGLAVHWALSQEVAVIAGAHQGFSPVSPGQPDSVEPEKSLNAEAGVRLALPASNLQAEAIGFVNVYDNLSGECTFSAGCAPDQLDQQFNAGEALVGGVEFALYWAPEVLCGGGRLPIKLGYTFTHAEFSSAFNSDNPQWGAVEAGDLLPYVPQHQLSLDVGVDHRLFGANVSLAYVSEMRESASAGDPAPGEATDPSIYLDVTGSFNVTEWLTVYARAENLLFEETIVSRRPFGARPGKPFGVSGGLKLKL